MFSDPLIITNGKVVTPGRVIPRGGVAIREGTIFRVFSLDEAGDPPPGARVVDVGGRVIAPGFIDLHVHGGGGADLMDGEPEAVLTMARAHVRGGTTGIVPTTLTSSMEDLHRALDSVRIAKARYGRGEATDCARILGVHLEGPYFAAEYAGAQDPRYLSTPHPGHYQPILDYSPDIVRISAAPELPGGLDLGRELRRRGILASLGHTGATYDEVVQAVQAGYTHVTHLYSAMSGVRRVNAYRTAGAIESAFILDELTVEIIADGKHLPASLIRLIHKCKGAGRIALVTDAMRAAGLPEGEYILGSLRDGQKVIVEDGVAKLPDRSAFAASVATMNRMVGVVMRECGIPLREAVEMASTIPAKILGIDRAKGSLEPGKDADVAIFDEETARVWMTIVEGRIVYQSTIIDKG